MSITMYKASVPVIVRALTNLKNVLQKGAAHAETSKFDPAILIQYRLYPDMFALARQVQIATDHAKGCVARLSGQEPPSFEDSESSFPELLARIDKTLDYVRGFKPEQIDGSEERKIVMKTRIATLEFSGLDYLTYFVLPNLYFHTTTAYDILRHNGVPVGKMDYVGAPPK